MRLIEIVRVIRSGGDSLYFFYILLSTSVPENITLHPHQNYHYHHNHNFFHYFLTLSFTFYFFLLIFNKEREQFFITYLVYYFSTDID